jgi:PAS domain S-box-containing protein
MAGSGSDDVGHIDDELLRQVYDSVDTSLLLYDHDADAILGCNDTACDLLGYSHDQLQECSLADLDSAVAPATEATLCEQVQQTATAGDQTFEWAMSTSDGEPVPVTLSTATLSVADGTVILLEVSDLREQTFRGQGGRIDILDRMTDAFFALDGNRRFTYLNEQAHEIICEAIGADLSFTDLQGRRIWDEIPEIVGTRFYEKYEQAFETGETATFEAYYEPLDTWFEVNVYPSETGLSVFFQDVTEKRRAIDELEDTVEVLHDLYVLGSDSGYSFEYRLDRILELGCRRLDLPYGFLTQITDETQLIEASRGDHELLQPGEQCPLEESYCRRTIESDGLLAVFDALADGWGDDPAYDTFQLGCYLGGKIIVNDELYGTLCFASDSPRSRDFTESERTFVELASRWVGYEIERQQYRTELERQNQRLGEFANLVSHDLRNPLNAANTQLELVEQEHSDEHVEAVGRALDRMEAIITDLLTLAREGDTSIDLTTVSLPELVDRCWERVAGPDSTLTVQTDREIYADDHRLQRLFENLLRNAHEHASRDVTVTVGDLPDGFYIEDDGPGIPPAERDQVFEVGYSTAEDGTGFGLHIVETIVEAHDWEITITDGTEGGARFEVTGVELADPWQG